MAIHVRHTICCCPHATPPLPFLLTLQALRHENLLPKLQQSRAALEVDRRKLQDKVDKLQAALQEARQQADKDVAAAKAAMEREREGIKQARIISGVVHGSSFF